MLKHLDNDKSYSKKLSGAECDRRQEEAAGARSFDLTDFQSQSTLWQWHCCPNKLTGLAFRGNIESVFEYW